MVQRQEVLNVVLAQLLVERGIAAAPELILRAPYESPRLPDVLLDFQGLRLAIEAEFVSSAQAATKAYAKAQSRVEDGIAHMGMAVVYPEKLRHTDFGRLKEDLKASNLNFAVCTEISVSSVQLELFEVPAAEPVFIQGNINDLINTLRRSFEQLIREDVLEQAVQLIERAIAYVLQSMQNQPATTDRMANVLGVKEAPEDSEKRKSRAAFSPRQRMAVNRISALILVNALIFQEVLSQKDSRVLSLGRIKGDVDQIVGELQNHWNYIVSEINYYPIFGIAHDLISCFSSDRSVGQAVCSLIQTAKKIVSCRASLRHDLAGRIYHRLLEEAKFLGAYYTSIPSATLLLKLALRPDRYECDWRKPVRIAKFRLADLACGTGTLLMASADTIVDNYIKAAVSQKEVLDLSTLHSALVENVIYGFDVLASAVHLTASTLSLRVPERPIDVTHLYQMPLGGPESALGSLEFLESDNVAGTLFGVPESVGVGGRGKKKGAAHIPPLDLCVMNPPFTRSVGGNLLFGNLPEKERGVLQKRLKNIVNDLDVSASITAGLGSLFVALGDMNLKAGGTLALVLPKALICGVAWKKTRELINENYYVEYIVVSHEPQHWNFSENTSLSEVLLVARKKQHGSEFSTKKTMFVNLWRQPKTSIEALSLANDIIQGNIPDLETTQSACPISIGKQKYGEAFSMPWSQVKGELWSFATSFAQVELNRVFHHLRHSRLYFPNQGVLKEVPLKPLKDLADFGFDRRDMHDAFSLTDGKTSYPAIWGHDAKKLATIAQNPNQYLQPLALAKEGRPLREAKQLWKKSGRLLIVERLRLNTMRLAAVWAKNKLLSNVWWTVVFNRKEDEEKQEKSLALWLNSTLGLILLMGYREETEGAWIDFKKPILEKMPVLDVTALNKKSLDKLADTFDRLSIKTLLPFPLIASDQTRIAIDAVFASILKLPDLAPLRQLVADEPVLSQTLDTVSLK